MTEHGNVGNRNAVSNSGGSAPPGNTNAVTHGLHVENNKFYQSVMDDELRELCDRMYGGYVQQFRERHGPVSVGHLDRLFEIAVNQIKMIYSDNWAADKPDSRDSGNPMVDKEITPKRASDGTVIQQETYKPSPVLATQQSIRSGDREWLKQYGLLG
jgi:hypothetical protein